jgi:hypothetical protein
MSYCASITRAEIAVWVGHDERDAEAVGCQGRHLDKAELPGANTNVSYRTRGRINYIHYSYNS